jgi:hypothetical protein
VEATYPLPGKGLTGQKAQFQLKKRRKSILAVIMPVFSDFYGTMIVPLNV